MVRDTLFFGHDLGDSKALRWIIALCAPLALAACAPEPDLPRENAGTPTIVSLNPCLDAILVEVARPDQILALSHYSRDPSATSMDPAHAKEFGVTGGTVEEVLALEPDLVVASSFLAPNTRAAFERMGVRVETFGSPTTVEDSLEQVRRIAALVGGFDAGEALVTRILASPPQPQGAEFSALLWQPGQIVPGEATLVSEHLRWAGLASHSAARGLGQADFVSLETLLADPPEIVLVAGGRPGQTHPLLAQLPSTLVTDFKTSLLYCGGPTIPRARQRLIEARERFERKFRRRANP